MEIQFLIAVTLLGFAQAVPEDICDRTFDVANGNTETINYFFDNGYPSRSDCVFHLRATGSERMQISFIEFDVEKHSRCGFDYLQIYNGQSTTYGQSIAKLCGYDIPKTIQTDGNEATLRFVSDRTLSKSGFILQFTPKSLDKFTGQCLEPLTKSTGSLQSPLYPLNYPNRVNCTYEITPTTGNQILITFPEFQLESSSYCVMDYVTIKTRSGEQIGPKLCGDLSGNSYVVPGSHAIVNFVSDRSSTRRGFELVYKVVASCDDINDVCKYGCSMAHGNMPQCSCRLGYYAPKGEAQCYDVNECETNNGDCQDHCTNTDGSYQCECLQPGLILSPDQRNCTDRTCAVDNAGCEQNCNLIGNGGAYHCTCNPGYTIAADRHNCTDIDECRDRKYQSGCEQLCVNEAGSYYCDCGEGYSLSTNRRTCDDVNECTTEGMKCEQDCTNYPGGWACSCFEGYELNPFDPNGCRDTDECAPDRRPAHCTDCANYEGGFSCQACEDGFVLFQNETGCLDLDECGVNNGNCQQECINTIGGYHCACYEGQALIPGREADGACDDINECAPNSGRGPCEHYCENSVGSFSCDCITGYRIDPLSGVRCLDVDECATGNGGCLQSCNNTVGSYYCTCFYGYQSQDGGQCEDIDECLELKPCDHSVASSCSNFAGGFSCECPPGYVVANGTACQDVDECAANVYGGYSHGCQQQCVNTVGSFRCECHPGYVTIDGICTDINECSQSLCEHNELCNNTLGSFTCGCRSGFYLIDDGRSCSDVDECAAEGGSALCDQICLNEIGKHRCGCHEGYELSADNYTCADVNECLRNTSGCSDGCANMDGWFRCYCFQGREFGEGNNKTCVDIDECATNNGGCHHVCRNTPGSFSCSCLDGYEVGADERCHDINECATSNGGCDQSCHNFNGTYNCTCEADFKLGEDDHTCGHCPDCATFEKLQADVEELKASRISVQQFEGAYRRMAVQISHLQRQVYMLRSQLVESSPGDRTFLSRVGG